MEDKSNLYWKSAIFFVLFEGTFWAFGFDLWLVLYYIIRGDLGKANITSLLIAITGTLVATYFFKKFIENLHKVMR